MSVEIARAGSTVAFHHKGTSSYALITFIDAGGSKNFDGQKYWGREFVEKNDINAIGVVTTVKNWFDPDEMASIAEAVRPLLAGHSEVVTYGTSMGGYGAIKFSRLFGATRAIAISPQYSIEPDRVSDFDKRFCRFFDGKAGKAIEASDVSGKIWISYDPYYPLDAAHIPHLLSAAPDARMVRCSHLNHGVTTVFKGSVQGQALIKAIIDDNTAEFRRLAGLRRKATPQYFYGLAKYAVQGHPNAVWQFLQGDTARSLSLPYRAHLDFLVHLNRGEIQSAVEVGERLRLKGTVLSKWHTRMSADLVKRGHFAPAQRLLNHALTRSPDAAGLKALLKQTQSMQ